MPGFADIVLILIVALFIFGASKLPAIAMTAGKAIVRMRKGDAAAEREAEEEAVQDKPVQKDG